MALTSEQETAANNGMWFIYPSHFEYVLDCQKKIKHKVQALEL